MAFVISQSCCADASCVSVCPVNCIHPTPDEPDFGKVDLLYIDPKACIDCGACADACPVGAARPGEALQGAERGFAQINADYYATARDESTWQAPWFTMADESDDHRSEHLRIAIVGTGPAASYTARHLLTTTDAQLSMFDRQVVPGGLLREGVAPDHVHTKEMAERFRWAYDHPRTSMFMNVTVGEDITHDDLLRHHHAVIYAVGASGTAPIGVPGEELDGVLTAQQVVRWYNGSPEGDLTELPLTSERVFVVGNGNVALDIARTLLATPAALAHTDVADHALKSLADNAIREVVLLGRRGPEFAAFTRPELVMLPDLLAARVVIADQPGLREELEALTEDRHQVLRQLPVEAVDFAEPPPAGERRLVFAFNAAIAQIDGADHVDEVTLRHPTRHADGVRARTGMVIRANGFRVQPIPGLPYDEERSRIPHAAGRVVELSSGSPVRGTYVVGWAKRGATGGIGTNKYDARETIDSLLSDSHAGLLTDPPRGTMALRLHLKRTRSQAVGARAALRVLEVERQRGQQAGRTGIKFVTTEELLRASRRFRGSRAGEAKDADAAPD